MRTMGVMDYFKSIPTMTADKVRQFMSERHPDEYNLVDVRQPMEYENDHIPGANLMRQDYSYSCLVTIYLK